MVLSTQLPSQRVMSQAESGRALFDPMPDESVRWGLVARVRQQIDADPAYDSGARLDAALDRLIDRLGA